MRRSGHYSLVEPIAWMRYDMPACSSSSTYRLIVHPDRHHSDGCFFRGMLDPGVPGAVAVRGGIPVDGSYELGHSEDIRCGERRVNRRLAERELSRRSGPPAEPNSISLPAYVERLARALLPKRSNKPHKSTIPQVLSVGTDGATMFSWNAFAAVFDPLSVT